MPLLLMVIWHAQAAHTAAEDLQPHHAPLRTRASMFDVSGELLGDTARSPPSSIRLLHHAHVLKCGPRSWRTKVQTDLRTEEVTK